MSTRKFLTAALVALALLGWGVVAARSAPQGQPIAGRASIEVKSCKSVWAEEGTISSKIPGRIARRLVDEGVRVKVGDDLAVLDDREVVIEYEIQKIAGNSLQGIRNAKAKLEEYTARADGAEGLIKKNAISREDYRIALLQIVLNEIAVSLEEEKHEEEKLKADRLKVILGDHRIKSPSNGIVQKCYWREGESVPANDLRMFRIVATDRVWVEGLVSANNLFRVRVGQPVSVRLTFEKEEGSQPPAEAKEEFYGKIVFLDPDVDHTDQTFRVRAEVENRSNKEGQEILHAGLHVNMTILLGYQAAQEERRKKGTTTK